MSLSRRSLLCFLFVFALAFSACGEDTSGNNGDNNEAPDADAQVDAGDVEEDVPEDTEDDITDTEDDVSDAEDDVSDAEDDVSDADTDANDGGADVDAGPECGDGVIEGDEICDGDALSGRTCTDEGFVGGDLSCNDTCDGYDTTACTNCGNDTLDSGEACDGTALDGEDCTTQGFDGGTLTCASDCTFDTTQCTTNTCGNSQIDSGEDCDGSELGGATCSSQGFVDGTLACNNCQFDTSSCSTCGDDTIDSGETCDGTDLGGETCQTQGFSGGTLACGSACGTYDTSGCTSNPTPGAGQLVITEIMQNPSATSDSDGEYFELLNNSGTDTYDLSGCQITGSGNETPIDITSTLEVAPGSFLTAAVTASPGFTPDYVATGLSLSNSSDRLGIECPDGSGSTVVVDEVSWDNGSTFPDPSGASMNLTDDPTALDATENDNGYWWCATPTTDLGNGDLGTPGAANEVCPTATIDFCVLQFPKTLTAPENTTESFYGQLYVQGVTDQTTTGNDPRPFIDAEFGYGPPNTDPATDPNWIWNSAGPNPGWNPTNNNNDEYVSTITLPSVGTYDTAYRFTGDYGRTFTYCDASDSTTTYDTAESGTLTTTTSTTSVTAYFSEYIEGSSNNKALEIYNPDTTTPVDLASCSLNRYSNGNTSPSTYTFPTGATIPADGVYTVCNSSIDGAYSAQCDDSDGVASWNGDDAIEMVCNGATLDVFGQIGVDPGSEWSNNGVSTADQTLRRKCSVTSGDSDGSDAFDPSIEWDQFAQDDFSDFGTYTCP